MKGNVDKSVRFVNIITDISQFFIDIYQYLYQRMQYLWLHTGIRKKRGTKKKLVCDFVISLFR